MYQKRLKYFFIFVCLTLQSLQLSAQSVYPILSQEEYKKLYPQVYQTHGIPFPYAVFADSWHNHIHVKNPRFYHSFVLIKGLIEWNNFWEHLGDTAKTILLPLPSTNWKSHILLAIIGPPAQKEVFEKPGTLSTLLSWPNENIEIQKSAITSSFGITLLTLEFKIVKKPWLSQTAFAPNIKYEYAPIIILEIPWDDAQYIAAVESKP